METGKLQLPLLNVTDADTLVFISPNPSPNPPHRVSSKALRASGSAVLTSLLGPTEQYRVSRRRGLINNLPRGIKFVIDLSPPNEGPEAVEVVLKLYCPEAITSWESGATHGSYIEEDDGRHPPLAHSASRHTAAIERILHILHGLDPQIRTTTMWYTVCKVAGLLNCGPSVVDYAMAWLYANREFIGPHPGIVLDIAADLKSEVLFKDAFTVIVGKTLERCSWHSPSADANAEVDLYQIPEAALPWRKNIIHAHRSLRTRIESVHSYLSFVPNWLDDPECVPEYAKMTSALATPNLGDDILAASLDLDAAIIARIVSQLEPYLEASDRGARSTESTNRQIFSKAHWRQLERLPSELPNGIYDQTLEESTQRWNWTLGRFLSERREMEPEIPKQGSCGLASLLLKHAEPQSGLRQGVLEIRGTRDMDRSSNAYRLNPPTAASDSWRGEGPPDYQAQSPITPEGFRFQDEVDERPPPPYEQDGSSSLGNPATGSGVPRGNRIEISNPVNKRKSPSESTGDQENLVPGKLRWKKKSDTFITTTDGSGSEQRCSPVNTSIDSEPAYPESGTLGGGDSGELEIFNISGIHEEIDHLAGPSTHDKGKGKEVSYDKGEEEEKEPDGEAQDVGLSRASNIPIMSNPFATFILPLGDRYPQRGNDTSALDTIAPWSEPDKPYDPPSGLHKVSPGARATDWWDDPEGLAPFSKSIAATCSALVQGSEHVHAQAEEVWHPDQKLSLEKVWKQSLGFISKISRELIAEPTFMLYDSSHLLMCLNDEEWKFLPIWAGGLDDGSGGVFGELQDNVQGEDDGEGSVVDSYADSLVGAESVESFEARVYSEDEFESTDAEDFLEAETTDDDGEWNGDLHELDMEWY